jgi:hypothetical protein
MKRKPKSKSACPIVGFGEKFKHARLTESQCKALKPDTKAIGCGVYGCAYPQRGSNKVVKFTADPEDVAGMKVMQDSGDSVKLYEAYRLRGVKGPGDRTLPKPVYAVVVEKVKPLNYEDAFYIDQVFGIVARSNAVVGILSKGQSKSSKKRTAAPEVLLALPGAKANIETGCKYFVSRTRGANLNRCLKVALRALDITRNAAQHGMWFTDSHSGNFGYGKGGKIIVSDLGLTYAKFDKPPADLRGWQGL